MGQKKRTRKQPQRLSGITNGKDRREALETFVRAFTGPEQMERHMVRSLWRGTYGKPEYTRLVVAEGRVVSVVAMAPRNIRFGAVAVPSMTIGPVGTHDHYRKRGYGFAAMSDVSRYMEENGFLVAYLQGISDYYHRYGYYPYGCGGVVEFDREPARKAASPGRLRRMKQDDLPRVRKIFEEVSAGRTCAAVRDGGLWEWLWVHGTRTWLFRNPRVILDDGKRICGYLTGGGRDRLEIREIVVRQNEEACRAALGAIVREVRRVGITRIGLPLPWDDALAVFIRQYVGCEFKLRSNPTGGLLMKVVDFPALMQRLEPTFTQRWKAARVSLSDVRFAMATETDSVGLTVSSDGVHVGPHVRGACVRVPQRWLSGLLTGYHGVREIALREGASVPSRLIPVMEILFPRGWPYVYQGDNY